jgi:hypothetical protein
VRIATSTPTYFDVVEAPSPTDPKQTVQFGVRRATFRAFGKFGWKTPVAQFYGIVQEGLILAEHAFRGLNRPMRYDDSMEADRNIVVYSWCPVSDYEWTSEPYSDPKPTPMPPPIGTVFVVLVREEKVKEENADDIVGTIEKWNWVREDTELRSAPTDWKVRYADKLWSRNIP